MTSLVALEIMMHGIVPFVVINTIAKIIFSEE